MKKLLRVALPLALWLGLWQGLAMGMGQPLLLPSPAEAARRLGVLALSWDFWKTCLATLLRVLAGGGLGVILGALVAGLSARFPLVDWLFTPIMKVVRATPVASFILLIWLWCATGWVPAVIAGLMATPVVWAGVRQGISGVDPQLLEMAEAYRFTPMKTLGLIYFPSVEPAFLAGAKTALGLSWKAGVAAEVLCRPKWGMGSQVYNAKLYLETPDLFAWTVAVIVLSWLVEKGLGLLLDGRWRRGAA